MVIVLVALAGCAGEAGATLPVATAPTVPPAGVLAARVGEAEDAYRSTRRGTAGPLDVSLIDPATALVRDRRGGGLRLTTLRRRPDGTWAATESAALPPAAAPTAAPTPEDGVSGTVDPSGVTITIVRWRGQDRVYATGAGGGADATGCDWAVVPLPAVGGLPVNVPLPPPPDSHLGLLTCNGEWVRALWIGPHNTVDLEAEARRRVEEYVAHVPVPPLTLHANPAPAGLVGIESWFWVTGWDGAAVVDQIDALGFVVDVRIEPTPVRWAFGDGAIAAGHRLLGHAPPGASPVAHVFQRHGTRPVTVGVDLVPRYRIDGTDWEALPAIPLSGELGYRVREVEAYVFRE